jgi:hypothetical protein
MCMCNFPIIAKQRLGKHILAAIKNRYRCPSLCGPCRIKRKYAMNSSHNFLLYNVFILIRKCSTRGTAIPYPTNALLTAHVQCWSSEKLKWKQFRITASIYPFLSFCRTVTRPPLSCHIFNGNMAWWNIIHVSTLLCKTHGCIGGRNLLTNIKIILLNSSFFIIPLSTQANIWPTLPAPDDRWWYVWSSRWNDNWQGKPINSEKTCPSATLSTTNPTWPDLESKPGRSGGKPATNRLSYGTAYTDVGYPTDRNSIEGIGQKEYPIFKHRTPCPVLVT